MKIDARVVLLLIHPDEDQILLLKRKADKLLFPGLITGIGGAVEANLGEHLDIGRTLIRECFKEETKIKQDIVTEIKLDLVTSQIRGGLTVLLFWYTGKLSAVPEDLSCTEGELNWYPVDPKHLPNDLMVPTASLAIPFILANRALTKTCCGVFTEDLLGKLKLTVVG